MALIEMSSDFRRTNELLERIAQALEKIVLLEYGQQIGHCAQPARDPHPEQEPTVDYTTDEQVVRYKLEQFARLAQKVDEPEIWTDDLPG